MAGPQSGTQGGGCSVQENRLMDVVSIARFFYAGGIVS